MAEPGLDIVVRHLRMLAPSAEKVETSDQELLERFVRRHDQAAFAALLRQHGPMIHGLCRRLLRQEADADDVFQATFLILLRKAHTIRKQLSLASWLYGVAYRIASRVRKQAIRQSPRGLEEKLSHSDPGMAAAWRELCVVLDAEVHALPERQRAPVVLCYLEGRTRDQAARELGWTLRTLERRLEQGRERLRLRLTRRGLALSTALLASALSQQTVAAVPAALCDPVLQAVGRFRLQGTLAGSQVSSRAGRLAAEGLRSIAAAKVHCIAIATLTVSMLVAGSGALAFQVFLGGQTQATQQNISKPSSLVDERPNEVRQPRTDRFGDPLPEGAISRLGSTRLRHGHFIYFLRFTPDGKTLVSSAADGIGIWGVSSGKLLHFLQRGGFPGGMSLSADGSKLVVGVESGIVIWDVASGKQVRTLGAATYANAGFSPDGTILAVQSATKDCLTELLDPVTGEQIRSWRKNQNPANALAFTKDGKTLIAAGTWANMEPPTDDHEICFWDLSTGNERRIRTGTRNVSQIALSPDGTLLAAIYSPILAKGDEAARRLVCLWDVASGRELRQLIASPIASVPGRFDYLNALAFSPDGKSVCACLSDGTLISWDPLTGIERRKVGPDSCYSQLAFAPDGKTLATLHGFTIRLVDVASGKDLFPSAGHQHMVSGVAFAGDGRTVVTSDAKRIFLWDKVNGQELREFDDRPDFLRAVCVMSDGRRLLSCEDSDQGKLITLRIKDLATGKQLRRFDRRYVARKRITVAALAPDDSKVALGGFDDEAVLVIDLTTGNDLRQLQGHKSGIFGAAFTPDSRTLVVWGSYRKVRLWDVSKGQLTKEFNLAEEKMPPGRPPQAGLGPEGNPYTAVLSPDAKTLSVGDQLYEVATGRLIQELSYPKAEIVKAFSPDGRTLACPGHQDGAIYLLERATGRERRRFLGHKGRVESLAFSADGRTLISGGWDTTCVVWDLTGRLTEDDRLRRPLAEKELNDRWEILAGGDATKAYRAIQELAAAPAQAIPFLSKYLRPTPRVDQKHVDELVRELGNPQFAVRQRATQELDELEELAIPSCQRALADKPTPEVRRRLESLLATRSAEQQDVPSQCLRTLRALEALELCGTPEAAELLKALTHGAPEACLTREAEAGVRRLASRASGAQQSDRGSR